MRQSSGHRAERLKLFHICCNPLKLNFRGFVGCHYQDSAQPKYRKPMVCNVQPPETSVWKYKFYIAGWDVLTGKSTHHRKLLDRDLISTRVETLIASEEFFDS